MKQSNEDYAATRNSLYLKELSGARERLLSKSLNQTFFFVKRTLSDEVEFYATEVLRRR